METWSWSLKDEIPAFLRAWHWLFAFFILGGLVGWLVGLILPARYEAQAGLSVSFNSDAEYLTPDDYKNWQVAELNDFILSRQVLSPTIDALQASDPRWADWTEADLQAAVTPRWRNAGVWQLSGQAGDPDSAVEIVSAWRSAILVETAEALSHAVAFDLLDRQLDAQAHAISLVELDLVQLQAIRNQLQRMSAGEPAAAAVIAAHLANLRLEGGVALPPLPGAESTADEIATWIETVADAVEFEIQNYTAILAAYQENYRVLGESWLTERESSQGLSAYLDVAPHEAPEITVTSIYPSGSLSLVGALVGLMAWLGYRFVRVALWSRREASH